MYCAGRKMSARSHDTRCAQDGREGDAVTCCHWGSPERLKMMSEPRYPFGHNSGLTSVLIPD